MIELHSRGEKEWATPEDTPEDRTVLVVFDPHFDTWCDAPHPMRFSKEDKERFAKMSKFEKDRLSRENWEKYWALLHGKKGYLCPGDMEHSYGLWTVEIAGEWTEDSYDTFKQALGVVERKTGEEVKLVRRRKPNPVENEVDTRPPHVIGAELRKDARPTEPSPFNDDYPSPESRQHAWRRYELEDELWSIKQSLARYDELMQSDDAPFVDQDLHAFHLKRKSELEALLA